MRYKLAIFDMDGTILDTLRDLADAINHALSVCGLPARSIDEVREFVGSGRKVLIKRAAPDNAPQELLDELFFRFDQYYKPHCTDHTKPYDMIPGTLRRLRAAGVRTSVSSNKSDAEVRSLAGRFFPGLFDLAIGDREDLRRKPFPDSAFEIMRALDVPPADTVYIGDSDIDIQTALNAGTDIISVCWGFRGEDFLIRHGAKVLAHSPEELVPLIIG